jgi:hypothetical protein
MGNMDIEAGIHKVHPSYVSRPLPALVSSRLWGGLHCPIMLDYRFIAENLPAVVASV